MKAKVLVGLFIAAIFLAIAGAGGTFLVLSLQEKSVKDDLKLTRSFIEQKQFSDAQKMIDTLLDQAKGTEPWYPQVITMRLEIERAQGDLEKAKQTAKLLIDPSKNFDKQVVLDSHIFLAETALDEDDAEAAKVHFESILKLSGPDGPGGDLAQLGLARMRYDNDGPSKEMQTEMAALLEKYPKSPHRSYIEHALGDCNMALLFASDPSQNEGHQIYVIQKGDRLDALAKKNNVSAEIIQKMNGIKNPRMLTVGRRLILPSVDFSIEVDKSANTLTLFNHGKFFKKYRVRTGKMEYMTPPGEYRVTSKVKNPRWSDPKTGKSYPPNHPENELGTRWMAFSGSLGIHGTIKPETIGAYASSGCVGMLMPDVEELYDLVGLGTPVKIFGKLEKQKGDKEEEPEKDAKPVGKKKRGKRGAIEPTPAPEEAAPGDGEPAVDLGATEGATDSAEQTVSVPAGN